MLKRRNKQYKDTNLVYILVMEEIRWSTIEGFENYSVSDNGFVRNDKTGRILKTRMGTTGYYQVNLCLDGIIFSKTVHRIVAQAFCSNPNNYEIVDHIDRDQKNNHFSNLRWCDYSQNNRNRNKSIGCYSRYIGVSFYKSNKKWRAALQINGKKKHLGCYDTEEEAYEAFKTAVVENNLQDFYNL